MRSKTESRDRKVLRKWFGDLEVIEAKRGIRIQPNEEDAKNAKKLDPRNCVFSKACQRMWGSRCAVFFGTIAYVDLLDKKGIRHVERFTISSEGKRSIDKYDSDGSWPLKSFWLLPPTKSVTSKARSKQSKLAREKRNVRRKAILSGKVIEGTKRPKRNPSATRLSTYYRNGQGMVHFN